VHGRAVSGMSGARAILKHSSIWGFMLRMSSFEGVPRATKLNSSAAWATLPTGRTESEQMALPFLADRNDLLSDMYTMTIFWMM